MNRSEKIDLLENFSTFLAANGYMDDDWRSEPPYAIDEFLKLIDGEEPEGKGQTAEVFFNAESERQWKASKGFFSDEGTLPKIPFVLRPAIYKLMTEFASLKEQEAYRQAQAGIDKVMDRLKFADESLVKHPDCYTDERIKMALDFISTAFHELEKLK